MPQLRSFGEKGSGVRPLKGQVVLSAAHLTPGKEVAALAKNNAGMDALRAANWKEESKDFGGAGARS